VFRKERAGSNPASANPFDQWIIAVVCQVLVGPGFRFAVVKLALWLKSKSTRVFYDLDRSIDDRHLTAKAVTAAQSGHSRELPVKYGCGSWHLIPFPRIDDAAGVPPSR
jgi:hypothetical protein